MSMKIVSDNVLVAVAFYIGSEKHFDGATPYAILTYLTASSMVTSEIIAKIKSRKESKAASEMHGKNLIISNLIPFTKLNLIFAFSLVFSAIIRGIQRKQMGLPNLSIQIVWILLCLLFTNKEAKENFKRKYLLKKLPWLAKKQTSVHPINHVTVAPSSAVSVPVEVDQSIRENTENVEWVAMQEIRTDIDP